MTDVVATPAPTQDTPVETPVTVRADVDAARRGDFDAMQRSVRADRSGTPLERVSVDAEKPSAAAPTSDAPPERTVSKRQQQINDYERRIAEQEQRIADLERRTTASPERRPDPAPIAKETPAYKRYASLPNAPKLTDVDAQGQPVYESVEEHSAAMALFVQEQREQDQAQSRTFESQRARFEQQAQSFNERLAATAAADPAFTSKIAPALLAPEAVPLVALPRGARATFVNVVAQAIWEGADPARLLPHLHADGDKAALEIGKLPPDQWLTALHRLDGRLAAGASSPSPAPAAAAPVALPSTISAAPPPAPKVTGAGTTTNPADTALARGDVAYFQRQDLERRAAGRRTA